MLLDVDVEKTEAFLRPLIESRIGSPPLREQLKKFAAEQGLQI
jgi:hypothetical protein